MDLTELLNLQIRPHKVNFMFLVLPSAQIDQVTRLFFFFFFFDRSSTFNFT